jgi:DNA invertase Pin-like site-specific DNA recombinase
MLRILGAVRLSRTTDETTSPARQREVITGWASLNSPAEVVGIPEDLDVSGAVSPFERPGLGPWLSDPAKVAQWDVLVAWKMDRVSRSALDTLKLLEWAGEHGKRIVAVSDMLDSSSQMGRTWMQFAAIFAEMERSSTMERVLSSKAYLRSRAKWLGGNPPYGYRSEKSDEGKVLVEDPTTAPVLRDIVRRVIEGEPASTIARDLNRRGVPTPRQSSGSKAGKGAAWYGPTIRNMLRHPAIRGYATHRGHILLSEAGLPLRAGPELVSADEWELVQVALDARAQPRREQLSGVSPLHKVLLCECGATMYASRNSDKSRRYICANGMSRTKGERCHIGGSVRADVAEEFSEREFLRLFGRMEVVVLETIPGQDHRPEMRELKGSLDRLDAAFAAGAFEGDPESYARMRRGLRGRLTELEAMPRTEAQTIEKPLGITFGMEWEASGVEQRRRLMLGTPFRVYVGPRVRRGRTTRAEVFGRLRTSMEPTEYPGEDFL